MAPARLESAQEKARRVVAQRRPEDAGAVRWEPVRQRRSSSPQPPVIDLGRC